MIYRILLFIVCSLLTPLSALARSAPAVATYEFVKGRARAGVARTGWGDATAITRAIFLESKRYGFDPLLVAALIEHESGFGTRRRGSHGEIGLMQIKPVTARWIAGRIGMHFRGKRSLENPAVNVRFGLAYLDFLRNEFARHGSHFLTAYNMGQGNAQKVIRRGLNSSIYARKVLWRYENFSTQLALNGGMA